ncbi:MAG: hypothetical protein ACFFD4_24845 [Candidatus Odinarchaeota archaeon]
MDNNSKECSFRVQACKEIERDGNQEEKLLSKVRNPAVLSLPVVLLLVLYSDN